MTSSNPAPCPVCHGQGLVNEPSNDPNGQSFDTILVLFPILGIGFVTLLIYILGSLIFGLFSLNAWLSLIAGLGIGLLITAICLKTIWRMIFPRKIECPRCKGKKCESGRE